MRTTHTAVAILAGALVVTVPATASAAPHHKPSATNPHTTCEQVDLRYVSTDTADRLLALGWVGRAGDGVERLYSDACPFPLVVLPGNAAGVPDPSSDPEPVLSVSDMVQSGTPDPLGLDLGIDPSVVPGLDDGGE